MFSNPTSCCGLVTSQVRVIYRARRNTYFLGVDCQVPGIQQPLRPCAQPPQQAAKGEGIAKEEGASEKGARLS